MAFVFQGFEYPTHRWVVGSHCFLAENGACIHARVHFHNRDSGLTFSVDDRPLNRRRAAIFRKQRGVDVQAAEPRQLQDRLRQNLTVSGNDDEIRRQLPQRFNETIVPRPFRLKDGQLLLGRQHFDRRRLKFEFTAPGTIRLSHDSDRAEGRRFEERVL